MTSQPDKLFRDKLESFQQPAPSGAWDRIESNLAHPVHKLTWARIAAGVALLSAAALVLLLSEKPKTTIAERNENTAANKGTTVQLPRAAKNENKKLTTQPATDPGMVHAIPVLKNEKKTVYKITDAKDSVLISPAPEASYRVAEITPAEEKESSSNTIVYTAEEVNSRFMKKKLPPQATPDSKEASGIQKLIGLAYAAKNSEAPLGNLRQKKDDILALNFGKKKGEN